MHMIHVIAVEADSEAEAIDNAESAIADWGNGDVWDWYEIGGRWDGYLDGKNAIRCSDNVKLFESMIDHFQETRNATIRGILDELSGKVLSANEVGDTDPVFGFPIPDPVSYARRVNQRNAATAGAWQELLAADDPVDWAEKNPGLLIGYNLRKLGSLLAGYYISDSHFFDGVSSDPGFGYVRNRAKTDPDRQWLVAIDLHN